MHMTSFKLLAVGIVIGFVGFGCSSLEPSNKQEAMGEGIVRGTLGTHPDWQSKLVPAHATEISGQVVALEGGAYVIEQNGDMQHRLPHDENTRIDKPAHVGDRVHAWLDERGRAVLIRNIDHE